MASISPDECRKCGACCLVLNYPAHNRLAQEFFKARGFLIVEGYAYCAHRCPHSSEEGCDLQNTTKPLLCRTFKVGGDECRRARSAATQLSLGKS